MKNPHVFIKNKARALCINEYFSLNCKLWLSCINMPWKCCVYVKNMNNEVENVLCSTLISSPHTLINYNILIKKLSENMVALLIYLFSDSITN